MRYTNGMAQDKVTFQLDITGAGRTILQELAMPVVEQSAAAIAARAQAMASSQSGSGISFGTNSEVGTIRIGKRAIATVAATGVRNAHESYIAFMALAKARDAGRI